MPLTMLVIFVHWMMAFDQPKTSNAMNMIPSQDPYAAKVLQYLPYYPYKLYKEASRLLYETYPPDTCEESTQYERR